MKLHVKISLLFAVLMLTISSILIISSYGHLTRVIEHVNKIVFDKILDDTASCLENDFIKISSEMELLSKTNLLVSAQEVNFEQKLLLLKSLLDSNRSMNAAYIGYGNKDFLLVRRLVSFSGYEKYNIPHDSYYVSCSINIKKFGNGAELIFYDKNFKKLKQVFDESYNFDVTSRLWYKNAFKSDKVIVSSPYVYFSTKEIGITFAIKNKMTNNVIGVDYTMNSLLKIVKQYSLSSKTRTIVTNSKGQILTANYADKIIYKTKDKYEIVTIDNIVDPVINDYAKTKGDNDEVSYSSKGEIWRGKRKSFSLLENEETYTVLTVTPEHTLMVRASQYRRELFIAGILTVLFVLPFVWIVAVLISKPLKQLSDKLQKVKDFDFTNSLDIKSSVVEITKLIDVSGSMINTIKNFQNIAETITKQRNYEELLNTVLKEITTIIDGNGGAVYLFDKDETSLEINALYIKDLSEEEQKSIFAEALEFGCIERDVFEQYLNEGMEACFEKDGGVCLRKDLLGWPPKTSENDITLSVILLKDSDQQMMGYIVFVHDQGNRSMEVAKSEFAFIAALSGFVSAAIEGQLLLLQRKELLESVIVLVADAIDAKSPYTGKHCQRVPIITKMIVEEASKSAAEPYKDFCPGDDEWEEIRVASWLHDCGKVITPVDVVDKATKLECIYNRIHEIRMRFELLKSYTDRDFWKELYNGGDLEELKKERERQKQVLDEEFAFVAKCNLGVEYMSDEAVERLSEIGERVWVRTLDNTLGLSEVEKKRYENQSKVESLPIVEKLLDDKSEHISFKEKKDYEQDNPWGFTMKEPEYAFNRGELYSLIVRKGNLTDEERYIINAHMIHTIKMLSALPFPKNMKNIVEIAGSHHERMDGGGYPRSIKSRELSLPARAMAIADIFEALTSSDRPYKSIKTLNESLKIMKKMASERKIDKDLFELFVSSGRSQEYAQKYLLKEQQDEVNIDEFLT